MSCYLPLGPLMVDLRGYELTADESCLLQHPLVGGIILFSRNYHSKQQLCALIAQIKALRQPQLLVGADYEGGRVQRFVRDFSRLPAMAAIGRLYEHCQQTAIQSAYAVGMVAASELKSCGIDLSFSPVVDLNRDLNSVIGDRSFHGDPNIVVTLAASLARGLADGGVPACLKHFPGHGGVSNDSHHELPIDKRSQQQLAADLLPFKSLIRDGIKAVMTAHISYPQIDSLPATFSNYWLQDILGGELGFNGVVISDDMNMAGAKQVNAKLEERVRLAINAGCHLVLACNNQLEVFELINYFDRFPLELDLKRLNVKLDSLNIADADCRQHSPAQYQQLQALVANCIEG